MRDYIIKVRYNHHCLLLNLERFRISANDKEHARELVKCHSQFPKDGEIISVKEAAYKKRK